MGLDHGIKARKVIKSYDGSEVAYSEVFATAGMRERGVVSPDTFKSVTLEFEVIRWRKSNQIFAWFDRNVCDNSTENCRDYFVDRDTLEQLRDDCKKVLATVEFGAPVKDQWGNESREVLSYDQGVVTEVMPSQSGFFFGNTEYDYWYFYDLEVTAAQIDVLLEDESLKKDTDFVVWAWW